MPHSPGMMWTSGISRVADDAVAEVVALPRVARQGERRARCGRASTAPGRSPRRSAPTPPCRRAAARCRGSPAAAPPRRPSVPWPSPLPRLVRIAPCIRRGRWPIISLGMATYVYDDFRVTFTPRAEGPSTSAPSTRRAARPTAMFTVPLSDDELERAVLDVAPSTAHDRGAPRRAGRDAGDRDVGGTAEPTDGGRRAPRRRARPGAARPATSAPPTSRRRSRAESNGHGTPHDAVARRRPGAAERAVGVPVRAAALPRQPAAHADRPAARDRLAGAAAGHRRRRCACSPSSPARATWRRSTSTASAGASSRPRAGGRRPGGSSSTGSSRPRPRASATPCVTATTTSSTTSGTATSPTDGEGRASTSRSPTRHVGRRRRDAVRQPALGPGRAAPRRAQLVRGRPHDAHRSVRRRRHHARPARRAGRRGDAVRDQRRRRHRVRRGAVHQPDRAPGPDRRRRGRGPQGRLHRDRPRRVGDAGAVRPRPGRRAVPLRPGAAAAAGPPPPGVVARRSSSGRRAPACPWWRTLLKVVLGPAVLVLAVAVAFLAAAVGDGATATPADRRRPRRRRRRRTPRSAFPTTDGRRRRAGRARRCSACSPARASRVEAGVLRRRDRGRGAAVRGGRRHRPSTASSAASRGRSWRAPIRRGDRATRCRPPRSCSPPSVPTSRRRRPVPNGTQAGRHGLPARQRPRRRRDRRHRHVAGAARPGRPSAGLDAGGPPAATDDHRRSTVEWAPARSGGSTRQLGQRARRGSATGARRPCGCRSAASPTRSRRRRRAVVDDEDVAGAAQVDAVVRAVEAERLAELAGPVGEAAGRPGGAPRIRSSPRAAGRRAAARPGRRRRGPSRRWRSGACRT